MGKLKQALIAFEEQRSGGTQSAGKKSKTLDPRYRGMVDDDADWAIHEAEFNDWLDKYEQSFGDEKGYLP
jgi:hypothetical protein